MAQHAKLFSASGSSRWLVCTASAKDTAEMDDHTSEFAAEGTVAHELADVCFKAEVEPKKYLGKTWCVLKLFSPETGKTWDETVYMSFEQWIVKQVTTESLPPESLSHFDFVIDESMVNHVQNYIDYCHSLVTPDSEVGYECKVDYSEWAENGFGTCDFSVASEGVLDVVDLKFGMGKKVMAEGNTQGMLYALGKWSELDWMYDISVIRIHIYQPRLGHIDLWECSVDELMAFAERVKSTTSNIINNVVEYVPGDEQCGFCKKKATCKALFEHSYKIVCDEFDEIYEVETKDLGELNNLEVSRILPNLDLIVKWAAAVKAYALNELKAGRPVDGYKLVRGTSSRSWVDPELAFEALKKTRLKLDEVAPRKVISPTQAEKLLGKDHRIIKNVKDGGEFVSKPLGGITMATVDDKRQSIDQEVSNDFNDIDDQTETE